MGELKNFKTKSIMKKSILAVKSLMVMVLLFTFSCNNDDGITCPEPLTGDLNATETEFAGKWAFTAMVAEQAIDITNDDTDNPNKDIYTQFTECQRDLVYDFKNDRNYVYNQGSVAEDCQNKQSMSGTWSLKDKVLTFVASCSSQRINIEMNEAGDAFSYDSTLNFQEANGGTKVSKVTFTYRKVMDTDIAE